MNVIPIRHTVTVATTLVLAAAATLGAQEATRPVTRLVAEPASVSVQAGQVAPIKVTAYDAEGLVVTEPRMRVSGTRGGVQITKEGVKGLRAGKYSVVVSTLPVDTTVKTVAITIPVTVNWPPVTQVGLTADPGRLYVGVTLAHQAQALHADGSVRPSSDVAWRWSSSNEAVASVDRFGNVTGNAKGTAIISATADGGSATAVAAPPITTTVPPRPSPSSDDPPRPHLRTGSSLDQLGNPSSSQTGAGSGQRPQQQKPSPSSGPPSGPTGSQNQTGRFRKNDGRKIESSPLQQNIRTTQPTGAPQRKVELPTDKKFPWLILFLIVFGFLAVFAGGVYWAVTSFGYQLVWSYPFLVK